MIEVMNWGGGVQPNATACPPCGCVCACDCLCNCTNVPGGGEYQYGEVNDIARDHCHNTQLSCNLNYVHIAEVNATAP